MEIDKKFLVEIIKAKSPIFFTGAMYDDIVVDYIVKNDTIFVQYYLKKDNRSIDHSIDTIDLGFYKSIYRDSKLKKALN